MGERLLSCMWQRETCPLLRAKRACTMKHFLVYDDFLEQKNEGESSQCGCTDEVSWNLSVTHAQKTSIKTSESNAAVHMDRLELANCRPKSQLSFNFCNVFMLRRVAWTPLLEAKGWASESFFVEGCGSWPIAVGTPVVSSPAGHEPQFPAPGEQDRVSHFSERGSPVRDHINEHVNLHWISFLVTSLRSHFHQNNECVLAVVLQTR